MQMRIPVADVSRLQLAVRETMDRAIMSALESKSLARVRLESFCAASHRRRRGHAVYYSTHTQPVEPHIVYYPAYTARRNVEPGGERAAEAGKNKKKTVYIREPRRRDT